MMVAEKLSSEEILKRIKMVQKEEDFLWLEYRSALLRETKELKDGTRKV